MVTVSNHIAIIDSKVEDRNDPLSELEILIFKARKSIQIIRAKKERDSVVLNMLCKSVLYMVNLMC